MGQVTPNIGIYIPAAGETNYDNSFAAGMINIDQHDHSGGPNKGVPITSSGLADDSVTFEKLNADVADNTTGIGTDVGPNANKLIILGILKNLFQLATATGFIAKNGSNVTARTFQGTANQIAVTNPAGVAGDPVLSLTNPIRIGGVSFDAGVHTLSTYVDSGTFNPGIAFGGLSVGITYATQAGFYTQIGNVVFYSINIVLTNKGSSTGSVTITGLPVTQGSTVGNLNHIEMRNVTLDAGYTEINSTSVTSTTNMSVNESGSGVASFAIDDTYLANNSAFRSNGFYLIQ